MSDRITSIIVTLQVDGTHCWPGVPPTIPDAQFLKYVHRHMFHVEIERRVSHNDRDVEIINLKHNVLEFFRHNWWNQEKYTHTFGSMSCEMIAHKVMDYVGEKCMRVVVREDGENGAAVYNSQTI